MQPALYEAFGLTVVEAMTCGLVVFVTNQGGPVEIVVDGVSGFHIDPHAVRHSIFQHVPRSAQLVQFRTARVQCSCQRELARFLLSSACLSTDQGGLGRLLRTACRAFCIFWGLGFRV